MKDKMNDYTEAIERTQKLVSDYAFFVKRYYEATNEDVKETFRLAIENVIGMAAADGMSNDELDELAEVEW